MFLDSVDDPLDPGSGAFPNPTYEDFVSMLENITNLANKRLKLLITSRFGVEKIPVKKGSMDCWRLDGENELDMESAVEMVRYHAGKTRLGEGLHILIIVASYFTQIACIIRQLKAL